MVVVVVVVAIVATLRTRTNRSNKQVSKQAYRDEVLTSELVAFGRSLKSLAQLLAIGFDEAIEDFLPELLLDIVGARELKVDKDDLTQMIANTA